MSRRRLVLGVLIACSLIAGSAKAVMLCIEDTSCKICWLYNDNGDCVGYVTNC